MPVEHPCHPSRWPMNDTGTRYVLVPADLVALVAEGHLTKEAAWLYVVLLGHHNRARRDNDVWPSRAVMAQGMGLKKPQSVDKYLDELRHTGLIVSERRKRASDMNTSSKHTLLLFVPRTDDEVATQKASHEAIPYNGQRYPRQRTAAIPSRGQELDEGELEQLNENDPIRRTSGRFAPDGARHEDSEDRDRDNADPWATASNRSHEAPTWENWHDSDRETFKGHVGETLISTGKNWKKGRFTAEAFYRAYRLREEGAKRWPGQYVETLSYAGEEAVDDWLIDQGLLRPEWQ